MEFGLATARLAFVSTVSVVLCLLFILYLNAINAAFAKTNAQSRWLSKVEHTNDSFVSRIVYKCLYSSFNQMVALYVFIKTK